MAADSVRRLHNEMKKLQKEHDRLRIAGARHSDLQETCLDERTFQLTDSIWLRRNKEEKVDCWTALIIGPEDTPYQRGFYIFSVEVDLAFYPHRPPKVKMLSQTSDGRTRMNPNLYTNGKVRAPSFSCPALPSSPRVF